MKELKLSLENANNVLQDYNFLEEMPRIFPGTDLYFSVTLFLEKRKDENLYTVMAGLRYTDGKSETLHFTELAKRMDFAFYPEDYLNSEPHTPGQ